MALKGITERIGVSQARESLKRNLLEIRSSNVNLKYSSPGGVGEMVKASYSKQYDLWWYFSGKPDQFWNPFGIGKPKDGRAVTGRCQINMAKSGLNRRVGGAFATDDEGNIFLMHNGTLGGGKKGINKTNFIRWYTAPLLEVDFDGEKADYFIVAELGSPHFFEQIDFFVRKVYEFKMEAGTTEEIISSGKGLRKLSNGESLKRNPYDLPERTISPGADHARIVNALIKTLREKGYMAFRTSQIDAYIENLSGQLTHIFEIKSIISTQHIYTAIGQLMMYGLQHSAIYVLVVEDSLKPALIEKLKVLNIFCITFSMKKKLPVFNFSKLVF